MVIALVKLRSLLFSNCNSSDLLNWFSLIASWYVIIPSPGIKPVGSIPCLFKWPPANTTPASANVDKGVYAPSFNAPPAYPIPLDASVFVPVRDKRFCFAVNNNPVGFLISAKYFVKRATSSTADNGAKIPPLNTKSLYSEGFMYLIISLREKEV